MCKILILWSEISLARWLLYGEIIAGSIAGAGIIWETMRGGEAFERVAQRCVIWGVVAETLISICLFVIEDDASAVANGNAATAIEKAATLEKEAAQIRKESAITEERLLTERRITARDRWQMETVVRAVLPRRINVTPDLITALKGLGPINLAIVDKQEPRALGDQFAALFGQAGIMGRVIWLPDANDHRMTTGFFGVEMYAATTHGKQVAEVLWQRLHMAGAVTGGGITPIGWEAIPKTEDTLIIGINDAVWQPQNGQPGEGLDEHGGAVPAPPQ